MDDADFLANPVVVMARHQGKNLVAAIEPQSIKDGRPPEVFLDDFSLYGTVVVMDHILGSN